MECPLCSSNAPFESTEQDDGYVTVEYRCDHGHIIQFLIPNFICALLIVGYDGDELYTIHFDVMDGIIQMFDWRLVRPGDHFTTAFDLVQVDMEGTGTEVANDNDPADDYIPSRVSAQRNLNDKEN